MMTAKRLPFLAAFAGLFALAGGCVRLSDEPTFICEKGADCEEGQKCSNSRCVARDYCGHPTDCPQGKHCTGERCVTDECSFQNQAADCNGYACEYGECERTCASSSSCADGFRCKASQCIPGEALDNGKGCKASEECESNVCCFKPSGAVCASFCPSVPNDSCTTGLDCASGVCCPSIGGGSACSAVACSELPECISSAQCSFGETCVDQKCVAPNELKQPGAACMAGNQCESGYCVDGVCRGTATGGDECATNSDCTVGRLCCANLSGFGDPKTCGDLNQVCPGSIGSACQLDSDCIDDACTDSYGGFCTKPCTSNLDCGTSPWGVANACETNGLGERICFPGCTTSQQCWDNLTFSFDCYEAFDSNAMICADG